MTRVIAHMVTRNEMHRYLPEALPWLQRLVTDVVVYDDQSDDDTLEFARSRDVMCARRPDDVPSFAQDESRFRAAAWRYMEREAKPKSGEWILCIDADEMLSPNLPVGASLEDQIDHAHEHGSRVVNFEVKEAFGVDEVGCPLIRTDGFWGGITACRLVAWRKFPCPVFDLCPEGGGSLPNNWADRGCVSPTMSILHYGYVTAADRQAKYQRYRGGRGHNPSHVASILEPPQLTPWAGLVPFVRQGP